MTHPMGRGVLVSRDRGRFRAVFDPSVFAKEYHQATPGASKLQFHGGRFFFDFPASARSLAAIRQRCKFNRVEFGCTENLHKVIEHLDWVEAQHSASYDRTYDSEPRPIPTTCPTPPWDHQVRAFWFAVDLFGGIHGDACGGALLGLDMGCGKTRVAIDLVQSYPWKRVLIFCPSKVVPVWPYQWKRWGVRPTRIVPLAAPDSAMERVVKMRRALSDQERSGGQPVVFVTNYEIVDNKGFQAALEAVEWDAVILDEGHRIKDPTGKRSKWFGSFADRVPCRLELTGTKEPNSPLDIFAQARFLDASIYGRQWTQFRATYAHLGPVPGTQQMVRVLGIKNKEGLGINNAKFCIEVAAEDVQQLPEEHHVDIPIQLGKKTRKVYEELAKDFVVQLVDEELTVANILVQIGKLQEITGGYVRDPRSGTLHEVGTEKRDALSDVLADLPPHDPVVVFYRFTPDADQIAAVCDKLGRPHLECSGRRNELDAWQRASGGEVLICQISAGKEGVDLTRSRWAIYYSLGYQPGEFLQSKKRQHRPGQKSDRVTYFHLCAEDTIDRKIYSAITKKQSIIDSIRSIANEASEGVTTA